MAATTPFNISLSPEVAPITCLECGNNMRCVRRMPQSLGEQQLFMCVSCGTTSERVVGLEVSDHEIQKAAEQVAGLKSA